MPRSSPIFSANSTHKDRNQNHEGQRQQWRSTGEGDSVTLIKNLKVKGTSVTLKRGTLIKNIYLTGSEDEFECRVEKVKNLVLRTEFLKKAWDLSLLLEACPGVRFQAQ